jgi:hypothetical protein
VEREQWQDAQVGEKVDLFGRQALKQAKDERLVPDAKGHARIRRAISLLQIS